MEYYLYFDNEVRGPYSLPQIQSLADTNAIPENAQYCQRGDQQWLPVSALFQQLWVPPPPPNLNYQPQISRPPCPYCGQPILSGSTRCGHCGGTLAACPRCKRTVAVTTQNKWVGIARGGTQIVEYCANCGTKLSGPDCFIATAAFGTPFATEVNELRFFRDETLLPHVLGRAFIFVYYQISPSLAKQITVHESLKRLTRNLLKPIVGFATWRNYQRAQQSPKRS